MCCINIAAMILILSLLLAPLGLPTLAAASDALDPLFGSAMGPWSAVRCVHPNNWPIEGRIGRESSCTCLAVHSLRCVRAPGASIISVEPPRSPRYAVEF
jgi:hypothetical protein